MAEGYPTEQDLQDSIEWAAETGEGSYILNDRFYPFIWGYTISFLEENRIAEPPGRDLPKYNIDWDIRNSVTGAITSSKGESMMGSFSFNTPEEGAQKWLKQIKERTVQWLWVTEAEKKELEQRIEQENQAYYDEHCSDDGDCPYRETCTVRWPGGHGLRGCRLENPDDPLWEDEE